LERIKIRQQNIKNGINTVGDMNNSSVNKRVSKDTNSSPASENKRPKLVLTPEQQAMIDRNRQKAIERLQKHTASGSLRDASKVNVQQYQPAVPSAVNTNTVENNIRAQPYIRPSVHKSDYIEYDFSTMQDTYGGFVSNKRLDKNGNPIEMTLNDWKNQQLEKRNLTIMDDDDELPPMDIQGAPKCFDCGSIDLDKKMQEIFHCRVCKSCKEKHPEKYSLLTKTECKEDYFLTEPELADLSLFKRIVKENPHSGTFSRMQLFLRYQIEGYAFKKWGSAENLDNEWFRREEMKKKRREKKFNDKLKEMRKKLRAEELTRNLRSVRDKKHVHDWSLLQKKKDDNSDLENVYTKRCIDCGMEVEEILM
jgi:DNA-repair protein complementing XP-A cells